MRTNNLHWQTWKTGEWISAGKSSKDPVHYSLKLRNDGMVVEAKWMVTGRCHYALKVNGKDVAAEVREPDRTYTYAVAEAMERPEGMSNVFVFETDPACRPAFVRGVIELTFADGRKRVYGTCAKNWRSGLTGEGPVDLSEYIAQHRDFPSDTDTSK